MADQMHHFEKTEIRPISFFEILTIPRFSYNYEDLHFQACLVTLNVKRTNNLFFLEVIITEFAKKKILNSATLCFSRTFVEKRPYM